MVLLRPQLVVLHSLECLRIRRRNRQAHGCEARPGIHAPLGQRVVLKNTVIAFRGEIAPVIFIVFVLRD